MDPSTPSPPDPPPRPRPGARLRLLAVAILVAGLLASTGVWIASAEDAESADGPSARIVGGRVDTGADGAGRDWQSERLGGRALVRTAAFDRWLGSLRHGRRLAWTLAGLALALAAACAWIAALMDTPLGP